MGFCEDRSGKALPRSNENGIWKSFSILFFLPKNRWLGLAIPDGFPSQTQFDPLFSMNGFAGVVVASRFKSLAGIVRHGDGSLGDHGKRVSSVS